MTDANFVGSYSHKVAMFLMKVYELNVLIAIENMVHKPQPGYGSPKRSWDLRETRKVTAVDSYCDER